MLFVDLILSKSQAKTIYEVKNAFKHLDATSAQIIGHGILNVLKKQNLEVIKQKKNTNHY